MRSNGSPNDGPPAWTWGHRQDPSRALLTCFLSLQIIVAFHNNEFKVTLPDGNTVTFPNRLCQNHLRYLCVAGLQISSYKLK